MEQMSQDMVSGNKKWLHQVPLQHDIGLGDSRHLLPQVCIEVVYLAHS